ncbi:MAG: hypothetical protein IPJ71_13215 [Bdellovibrionales bacterium]|nr:hypothetical protein [Bdellovibrionales bacterium]
MHLSDRISNEWLYALRLNGGWASQTKSLQSRTVDGLISDKLGLKDKEARPSGITAGHVGEASV